jgi:YHS domain-containing protein
MKSFIRAAALGIAVATTSVTGVLAAGVEINATSTGLAMRGYDPVSYFNGGPEEGSFKITAVHDEATYRFVSEENKATFVANPEAYTPAYGGYCAYGLAVGSKFDGDPKVWKIVDDVLYLNLAAPVQVLWEKDLEGHLESADANWEDIKHLAPADTIN